MEMSDVCLPNRDLWSIKRYSSSAPFKVFTKDISISNDFGAVSGRSHDDPILLTNDFRTAHPTYSARYSVNNYPTSIFDLTVRDTLSFTVYPKKNYRFNSEILESCFEAMGVGCAASNIRQLRRYRKFLGNIFYLPKENLGDEYLTTHNNDRINQV